MTDAINALATELELAALAAEIGGQDEQAEDPAAAELEEDLANL